MEKLFGESPIDSGEVSSGNSVVFLNGRREVPTMSSVLASSSRWLNDPRIREWITTESLRRNGADYPLLFGLPQLIVSSSASRAAWRRTRSAI